ncbi:EsaB/YukD family protein [Nocardioides sp. YIM 152588]|uniref:EsaB/YukD family protein n=1 Tax=Nocardioides sp. YIM 152588 TaxID=3158259 RepID=UPI0032E51634
MSGLLPVTVVAGERRADLALPTGVAVAELLPALAEGLGVSAGHGLRLVTAGGRPLDHGRDLSAQGVADGGVLALVAAPAVAPPRVYDDPVDARGDGRRIFRKN